MGSKILADICMENILNEAKESFTEKPILYVKYVDDCLCVYDNTKIDAKLLLTHLNTIDNDVKFTLGEEKDTKLPFLDILITREHNKFVTKVYRQPIDKGAKLNYNSNHSHSGAQRGTLPYKNECIGKSCGRLWEASWKPVVFSQS
jgi:hypothetical protein